MKTTIAAGGKPTTSIHASDRRAFYKVSGLALHVAANVPALKEIGERVSADINAILARFDADGNEKSGPQTP